MQPSYTDKIISKGAMRSQRSLLREQGTSLVHCHGCFDIVHPGHVRHLRFAAEQGDRLLVSVTPDRFVNKGPGRPMFDERLRAENLAALGFVDWVVIHDQPTASELLAEIQPDVYVKGAEYASSEDTRFEQERRVVEQGGGRVVFSGDDVVYSSSAIIESLRSIRASHRPEQGLFTLAESHDLSSNAIAGVFERAKGKRVMVLSESILDIYAHCHRPEIAQEHPMLSLFPDREECFDGGGAIIASHLASMGLDVTLCTPLGNDAESASFTERMQQRGVGIEPLLTNQMMPRKIRYLVEQKKVMKIDSSVRFAFGTESVDEIVDRIVGRGYDALIIADFGLGLFSEKLASRVIKRVRDHVGMILGDVSGRRAQLGEMHGADVLCPCEVELRQMLDADNEPLALLAQRTIEITGVNALCVTRAAEGMQIYRPNQPVAIFPALCEDPVDALGCGDALLTAMTASLLGNADLVQAGFVGSIAAAIEGRVHGNIAVSASQIIEMARQLAAELLYEQTNLGVSTRAIGVIEPSGYLGEGYAASNEYSSQ